MPSHQTSDAIKQIGASSASVVPPARGHAGVGAQIRRAHPPPICRITQTTGVDASSWPTHADARLAGIACLDAGKHVQVEIPLADNWKDAQAVADARSAPARGHGGPTRRSIPSHQWLHTAHRSREIAIKHGRADVFLPPHNINALGQPRSWTDHLLWHHAAPHS